MIRQPRFITCVLFVLGIVFMSCVFARSSYVAKLPDLGKAQAGESASYPKGSEIQQEFKASSTQQYKKTLQQGGSYQQPWGALKNVQPKKTKDQTEQTTTAATSNSQSTQTQTTNSDLDQLNLKYKTLYDNSYNKTSQNLKKLMTKKSSSKDKPLISQSVVTIKAASHKIPGVDSNASKKPSGSSATGLDTTSIHIPNQRVVRPTYTYFGVLQTQLNSDYPGPVRAKIVNGNLKGALLLGTFQRQKDKLQLKFNIMTYKDYTYTINAIAVDPNVYRTALADSVDHHYIERYGLFFLAAFAKGYADALESGSTTTTSGGVISTKNPLNPKERLLYAGGEIGNQLVPIMRSQINTPPTVKLNQGKGIGIMFSQQVILKPDRPKSSKPAWLSELGD